MAFKAMNQGWGEASISDSNCRKLADATNGSDEQHYECSI